MDGGQELATGTWMVGGPGMRSGHVKNAKPALKMQSASALVESREDHERIPKLRKATPHSCAYRLLWFTKDFGGFAMSAAAESKQHTALILKQSSAASAMCDRPHMLGGGS